MAPTKQSSNTTRGATRTPVKAARKTAPKKAAAATTTAKRAVKKAVEPVTRAAGAAARTTTRPAKATTSARRPPDAIQLLTADHHEVEALFARFEKTGDGAHKTRQDLVQRISKALSIHASIEEEVFYPAARRAVADARDEVLEALEEHHLVKVTLAELATMDPSHERYGAKVTVLIENVRHHVEEEESELFPTVRKALDASRLRDIGTELAAAKRTAPTRPHPEAPDTPPGNIVAQVLTAPLDVAANLTEATARRVRRAVG